jgi:beta-glucosidase
VCDERVVPEGAITMTTGWELYAPGLERTLLWVKDRYGDVPLYVTECGACMADPPLVDGRLEDPLRIEAYRQNLTGCLSAMEKGVDLRGYFAWSFLDNLEWAAGFKHRFGLVHVDFATQVRTIKASGAYYRDVIRSRGASLAPAPAPPAAPSRA